MTGSGNGNRKQKVSSTWLVCLAPLTVTVTRWPSYTNLTCMHWRSAGWEKMNFVRHNFQKLSSDRQTNRQTDGQTRPKLLPQPLRCW